MTKAVLFRALLLAAAVALGSTIFGVAPTEAARTCSQLNAPVCAVTKDGARRTFTNASCAAVEGARVLHKDGCRYVACVPGQSVCAIDPTTRKPATYNSMCTAEYYLATVVSDGKCRKG